jgi:hypothetical protein
MASPNVPSGGTAFRQIKFFALIGDFAIDNLGLLVIILAVLVRICR